jgi:hypothetical protein
MNTNVFYPAVAYINAITQAQNAVVTFTANHDYTVGENIGFRVTKPFGMFEINQMIGLVLAITPTTVTVNIDTSNFTPFSYASINTAGTTPPTCVPSSSGVAPMQAVPTVNLADAFDNQP